MKEQEKKQEQGKAKAENKTLSGTPEKSVWEQAAETIAGNNKLMEIVMKIVLSPITLVVGAGALVYCFIKIKAQNEEITKLKKESEKLHEQNKAQDEEFLKLKKKYKKLKELAEFENGNSLISLGIPSQKSILPVAQEKKKTYHTKFLE